MADTSDTLEGGCLCGATRYRVDGAPTYAGNCYCRDCQRAVGATHVAWFGTNPENFHVTGGEIAECETSPGIRRGFCPSCGTSLTFGGTGWTDVAVTVASLDDPERVRPESNVFLDHRASWAPWDPDLRNYPRFP